MSHMQGTGPQDSPQAGWYPDPSGAGGQRWWDGTAWSENVAPAAGAVAAYAGAPGYGTYVQPRKVGFTDAVKMAFANWKDYETRATVGEFWWYILFSFLAAIALEVVLFAVFIPLGLMSGNSSSSSMSPIAVILLIVVSLVFMVVGIGLFLVQLALTVRRLHDTDRSGWWYLISLIPFGSIVLLVLLVGAGTPTANQYGPVPQ